MIGQINGSAATVAVSLRNRTQEDTSAKEENTAAMVYGEAYVVDLNSNDYGTKNGSALSTEEIERIKEEADRATQSLRDLVEKLILKQSSTASASVFGAVLQTDAETAAQARQMISEDGQFGVKAVSDRIVSFAKAISGNDPDKLSELKKAIDKGFEMAGGTFGGKLPDICSETYGEIMRKLDEWGGTEQGSVVDITA